MASNFTSFKEEIEILISIPENNYSQLELAPEKAQELFPNLNSSKPIGVYLIYAILEGEYYLDFENQKNEIPNLVTAIAPRIANLQNLSSGISQSHQDILETAVKALKIYKSLGTIAEDSLEGQHHKIGINFIDELRKREILWGNDTTETNSLFLLFAVSITLAEIDMFLDCSNFTRLQLKNIIKYLETNQLATLMSERIKLTDILREKATYLLDKIEIRLRKRNQNKRTGLIIEYQERASKMKYFGEFMKRTISHYLEDESGDRFSAYCHSINSKLTEIHSKNKALRKGIALSQSIDNDISNLQDKIKNSVEDKFDNMALLSANCLLDNTIFEVYPIV